ncbi:MAG: regulator of sigma E protease [Paracoccaceae bacterium]
MELIGLLSLSGGVLFKAAAFIVVLSVIVSVHEYGHYIVGRWSGIHAEVFSLGFGKILYSRVDKHGTQWQVAAVPFGGYVKFLGDADASSRNDPEAMAQMDSDTRSRSFHGAALYKKALTIVAGPMANFILSSVIFTGLLLWSGMSIETPTVKSLNQLPEMVNEVREGDVILSVNGVETPTVSALMAYARIEGAADSDQVYQVQRGDTKIDATGPFPLIPLIGSVSPRSAAISAGLKVGDLILSVDGQNITAFSDLQKLVKASDGAEMQLDVWRAGEILAFTLAANIVDVPNGDGGFEQRALIGISGSMFFEQETRKVGVFEAVEIGVKQTGRIISLSLNALYHVASGQISTCNMQGPLGLADASGDAASQGLTDFLWIIALISTGIGMINLFPIPVLDGGHLVFFAYEAVTRRPPSDKAINILMSVGLFVIVSFMVFAVLNDFIC